MVRKGLARTKWYATTVLVITIAVNPAFSQSANHNDSNSVRRTETDISSIFARRVPNRDNFVIGDNGIVVPAETEDASSYEPKRFAYDEANSDEQQPAGLGSLAFAAEKSRGAVAAGDECGPSPFSATEVEALVAAEAARQGVDVRFAKAIVSTESGFDRRRNSPKGARGPMQLMPTTAKRFGVADICDAEQNIVGGITYLRELLEEFQNPVLAAAAYNAGEHRIYEYGGIPPFQETVSYVAKVISHQMNVPLPKASKARRDVRVAEGEGPGAAKHTSENPTGVLSRVKRGEFVGGVMQF